MVDGAAELLQGCELLHRLVPMAGSAGYLTQCEDRKGILSPHAPIVILTIRFRRDR
jgi:hypothetical protein